MDKNIYGKLQPQQYHGTYQPYRCTRKNGSKPGCKFVYLNFFLSCVLNSLEFCLCYLHLCSQI